VTSAPAPKPPTAMPVIKPLRSGKPLHQYGNRNNVTKPQPDSADQSVAQVEPPQFVGGEACQENSEAIKKPASERDHAWTALIQPKAADESAKFPA
jgi:hypothetical protein